MNESTEARRAELSYDVRVLVCPGCGAPYRSAPDASSGSCTHCGATHALTSRDETPMVVGDPAGKDEAARLAKLRAQLSEGLVVPKRFAALVAKEHYDDEDRAAVERGWTEARDAILAGKGNAGWDLCLYSATWLHFTLEMRSDFTVRRAHAESALGLLVDPKYRQRIRCKLAASTARAQDLEAAERWLAPCDPRPDDLLSDNEYRSARTMLAFRRGRFAEILELLGSDPGDIPVHRSMVMMLGVMRAHAHEQLGHLDAAAEQLALLVGQDAEAVVTLASRADLGDFCKQSLPAARARVAAIDASIFSVEFPQLTCDHCGADFEVSATTTEVRCSHCRAISAVSLRPLLGGGAAFQGKLPGARELTSAFRRKLLAQRATVVIPPDLAPLFHEGRLRPSRLEEAESRWREEVRRVAEGDDERSFRLMLLTTTILSASKEPGTAARRHARAMLETSLRVMRSPSYLLRLRCTVAILAAESGDFEAAATWLSRCDPRTDELAAYSALVLANAKIANLRGDFEETVRLLGPSESDAPVSLQTRVVVALIRAAALERLGREGEAVASLMPILRWASDARSALVQFVAAYVKSGEAAPTKSLPVALARYGRRRAIVWGAMMVLLVVLAFVVRAMVIR
jgi:hypothetical protein